MIDYFYTVRVKGGNFYGGTIEKPNMDYMVPGDDYMGIWEVIADIREDEEEAPLEIVQFTMKSFQFIIDKVEDAIDEEG